MLHFRFQSYPPLMAERLISCCSFLFSTFLPIFFFCPFSICVRFNSVASRRILERHFTSSTFLNYCNWSHHILVRIGHYTKVCLSVPCMHHLVDMFSACFESIGIPQSSCMDLQFIKTHNESFNLRNQLEVLSSIIRSPDSPIARLTTLGTLLTAKAVMS